MPLALGAANSVIYFLGGPFAIAVLAFASMRFIEFALAIGLASLVAVSPYGE